MRAKNSGRRSHEILVAPRSAHVFTLRFAMAGSEKKI
jgi:hypothetical protein